MSSCTFRCVPHTFFPSSSDVVSGGCHSPVTAPVSRPFFLKYPFFYSDTPFFFSRSRQARSCGFVCRPMYVPSPCPSGTATSGRTLAWNSKAVSASFCNLYEGNTFSDEFPAKSNHISLCKFMEQLPLFPKVSVADSQMSAVPIDAWIFLFYAKKAYSGFNHLLPSYPIKNIRIRFFCYTQKAYSYIFSWLPLSLFQDSCTVKLIN